MRNITFAFGTGLPLFLSTTYPERRLLPRQSSDAMTAQAASIAIAKIVIDFFTRVLLWSSSSTKEMPAGEIPQRASEPRTYECLEVELRAETPHARRLELRDAVAGAARRLILQNDDVALQNRALIRSIEKVSGDRQTGAVEEAEILRDADVELVNIREADLADRIQNDVERAAGKTGDAVLQRLCVALTGGQACADVEVPRQAVQAVEVRVPLAVDVDVTECDR